MLCALGIMGMLILNQLKLMKETTGGFGAQLSQIGKAISKSDSSKLCCLACMVMSFLVINIYINVTNEEIYADLQAVLSVWYQCITNHILDKNVCPLGPLTPVPKVVPTFPPLSLRVPCCYV